MSPRPNEQEFDIEEHTRTRRAIGDRTLASVNEIPQFRMHRLVDAATLMEVRKRLKASGGETVPTFNAIILKVTADLLPRQHGPGGLDPHGV